jgi:hypothetical protein
MNYTAESSKHTLGPMPQVENLRAAADEEFRRRCALERALRDAASAFKRELFEKGEELASLLVRCIHGLTPLVFNILVHSATAFGLWLQDSSSSISSISHLTVLLMRRLS